MRGKSRCGPLSARIWRKPSGSARGIPSLQGRASGRPRRKCRLSCPRRTSSRIRREIECDRRAREARFRQCRAKECRSVAALSWCISFADIIYAHYSIPHIKLQQKSRMNSEINHFTIYPTDFIKILFSAKCFLQRSPAEHCAFYSCRHMGDIAQSRRFFKGFYLIL